MFKKAPAVLAAAAMLLLPSASFADDSRLEAEIRELRARLEAVERELAESKKEKAKQAEARKAKAPPEKFQASGYIESRFTNVASSRSEPRGAGPEFQVSRARIRLNIVPAEHWLGSIEVNAGTRGGPNPVDLREVYFQYGDRNRIARLGQQRVPFGYQVGLESSRDRVALERARVFTLMFPSERDIGLVGAYNHPVNNPDFDPKRLRVAVGALNGEGINRSDGNADKSYAANLVVPVGAHEFGASLYSGSSTRDAFGAGVADETKRAVGIQHRYRRKHLETQFEYVLGELFGSHVHGGFLQGVYGMGRPGNLFVRGDIFDPDTGRNGDLWRRISLGWYRDLTPNFRLTTEYDFLRVEGTDLDNTYGVEAQLRF
jgi:hypothetical protein